MQHPITDLYFPVKIFNFCYEELRLEKKGC
jgi:hypothetical protein